jgi:hypothetical protein
LVPRRTRIVYTRSGVIASITLGVSGETVHVSDFLGVNGPAWGPDGRSIIFSGSPTLPTFDRIFIVRDGLPPVQVIPEATNPQDPLYVDLAPVWSWAN